MAQIRGSLERSWRRFARVVGAVPLCEDVASIPRRFLTGFSGPSASNRLQIWPRSSHDRAAIGPRSCVDRDPGARSAAVWSCGIHSMTKDVWSRVDRGSIGPRSWGSSTTILCRPMEIQRSGEFHASPQWKEVGVIESHPMRIVRSESIHTTPLITKNHDRPRSASDRGRSWPSTTYLPSRQITSVRWN